MRQPRELLIASRKFAAENRLKSWWCLGSTLTLWGGLTAAAVSSLPWSVRAVSSIAVAMVMVRLFVIYHDYQHGAILRKSSLAKLVMSCFGLLTLNPPSVWNRSHDHHHKHNSKTYGSSIGSYPVMTTASYAKCSPAEKFAYRVSRHPLTILLGYLTVFGWGMCMRPLLQNPRRHIDAAASVVIHISLLVWLSTIGLGVMMLGMMLPAFIASFVGAYLFYAQHNFPDAKYRTGKDWSRVDAALHSSSFIPMGAIMNWLTGNIGFHHVHHVNARIPFYRLPEAMSALAELQRPGTTTLTLSGIRECLRLKLWCPDADRLVGFDAVRSKN